MQKRVITLLMIIVGASLGISFLPSAWQAIGQQSTYLSYYQTSRTKTK